MVKKPTDILDGRSYPWKIICLYLITIATPSIHRSYRRTSWAGILGWKSQRILCPTLLLAHFPRNLSKRKRTAMHRNHVHKKDDYQAKGFSTVHITMNDHKLRDWTFSLSLSGRSLDTGQLYWRHVRGAEIAAHLSGTCCSTECPLVSHPQALSY
jgi:hypothetical protein